MNILRRLTLIIALGLVVTGCASTQPQPQQFLSAKAKQEQSESEQVEKQKVADVLSSNIVFAPAIDISYADVVADIDKNIGTNVRWGGKVIESSQINDSTIRLTVFGYPLSNDGRPAKTQKAGEESGRFIVDLTDGLAKGIDFKGRYVTLYGGIASQLVVTNGDHKKTLPVVNAQELVDWNRVDQIRRYASRRAHSHFSLGYGYGSGYHGFRLGYRHPYYGFGFSRRGHHLYGHRGFGYRGFRGYRYR